MPKFIFLALFLSIFSFTNTLGQSNEVFIIAGSFYDSEQNIILEGKIIHVKGNKIVNIGDNIKIPDNVKIIDLTNYTVLPGFIDAHTHVLFDQEPQDDFAEHSISTLVLESQALRTLRGAKRAQTYLDVGITSIKDLGNSGNFLDVALRDAINEGTIDGPRIFSAGKIMSSSGGQIYGVQSEHEKLVDLEYRIIRSSNDAKNAVREHINQGVDVIKICADNLPNNTRLSREEMRSITETAHQYGLTVTAHSISDKSAWDAIKAGVDGIEHGFFLADSTLNLMAEKNVFLVPTENSRSYMNRYYKILGSSPDKLSWIDGYMSNMKERLMKAIKMGVTIVAGSDNYTDIGVSRGVSSQDMFRAYYEAGMKPLNILQSATYFSAKSLKKENEIGILKPGAFADIIAIKGNIEKDFIEAVESVKFVMKDGKVHIDYTL
jgi:imidazolonepropionase-like amidohydrolase